MIAEQQPFSWGWEGRSWYYTCLTEVVAIRFHDPEPICFSYEAWFTLTGNVNRRMTDFCALEVPHVVHKVYMNIRVEVWCADSVRKRLVSLFSKKWYFPATVWTQFWHHSLEDLWKKKKVWLLHAGQWQSPPSKVLSSCPRWGIQQFGDKLWGCGLPNLQIWMSIIICEEQWKMKFMWKTYISCKNWKVILKE